MKLLNGLFIGLIMTSCSTSVLVENWKNPDIDTYSPNKVLLVGITPNIKAREQFESQLKEAYLSRGIESVMSLEIFEPSFTAEEKTENDLIILENSLIDDGFDTVLLTKVIGVENKIEYKKNYDGFDSSYKKFTEDYLKYQDAYYNPDYYDQYHLYHTETSMYCICPNKERELIWKGYIDVTDLESLENTVSDYVKLIVIVLDAQQLMNPQAFPNEEENEAAMNLNL